VPGQIDRLQRSGKVGTDDGDMTDGVGPTGSSCRHHSGTATSVASKKRGATLVRTADRVVRWRAWPL
jgi:hypothetical protein